MATVKLVNPMLSSAHISIICGSKVNKEPNLNPKTSKGFDSGMMESSKANGECGFGKRSHFNEINNKKV